MKNYFQLPIMENSEINQFYTHLKQEVLFSVEADEEGGISEEKFTELVISYLTEAGETENARQCQDSKENAIGHTLHKVNGYALSENYENLDLFISLYHGADAPVSVNKDSVTGAANRCLRFFKNAVNGYLDEIEESSPIFDLARTLKFQSKELVRINIFILTDGVATVQTLDSIEWRDILINYHLRDLEYLYKLNASKLKRIPIELDFHNDFGSSLPCLSMPTQNEDYESYLAMIPGLALAKIYEKYGARLLEQNVRAFLQFTGKVNKGIRETLVKEPHMFLAYNNGIAATAQAVEWATLPNGGQVIVKMQDLQIVNGGQTTASLFHSYRKGNDLSAVFVQMKLSVIKQADKLSSIVSRIAACANSQNKVSEADLSSNHPFHIQLELLSRQSWAAPTVVGTHQTRWFFERARGQYKDSLSREFTKKRQELFVKQNPKTQVFVKEDMAKYLNSWDKLPYFVVRGSQKNYVEFMKTVKPNARPDNIFFEDFIAKAILFRQAEKIYGVKPNSIGDMRYITVPYTLSWLHIRTAGQLDLWKIWKNQAISSTLQTILRTCMVQMEAFIKEKAPGSLYGEWAKKEDCWKSVLENQHLLKIDLSELKIDFINLKKTPPRALKSDADLQQTERLQLAQRLKSVPVARWKEIQQWGYGTKQLSDYQEGMVMNIQARIKSNAAFSDLELKHGLTILYLVMVENPSLLYTIDDIPTLDSTHLKVTLDHVEQVLKWDKQHKRLQDFEYAFMEKVANGVLPLSEKYQKIVWMNIQKVKRGGFVFA